MQPPGVPGDLSGSATAPGHSGYPGTGDGAQSDPNLRLGPGYFPGGGIPPPLFDLSPARPSKKQSSKSKTPRVKQLPPELDIPGPSSNGDYEAALSSPTLTFSPQTLGFMPSNYWLSVGTTFGEFVTKFLQRKNNANCRFPHKLYNALAVVDQNPAMYHLIGVQWVTDRIFKVDKLVFGRVLGLTAVDGGLFHRQGNFPSHGFGELTVGEFEQLKVAFDISDVDMDRVRLLCHKGNSFAKGSTEDAVTRCKWITEAEPRL
jgi:hypothetical protein